jgi:hypothetical protein
MNSGAAIDKTSSCAEVGTTHFPVPSLLLSSFTQNALQGQKIVADNTAGPVEQQKEILVVPCQTRTGGLGISTL